MTIFKMHNQCLRKKVFRAASKADAKAREWNLKAPPGPGLRFHAYACPLCGKYHVGRTRQKGGVQ